MSNLIVTSPQRPYTFPDKFKAVSNGDVYAGIVDKTDLENPANQIQVYVVGEDGSETPVDQPLKINSGGLLVYNGQPAKFIVKQNYSMLVKQRGKQVFYEANMAFVDPESAIIEAIANDKYRQQELTGVQIETSLDNINKTPITTESYLRIVFDDKNQNKLLEMVPAPTSGSVISAIDLQGMTVSFTNGDVSKLLPLDKIKYIDASRYINRYDNDDAIGFNKAINDANLSKLPIKHFGDLSTKTPITTYGTIGLKIDIEGKVTNSGANTNDNAVFDVGRFGRKAQNEATYHACNDVSTGNTGIVLSDPSNSSAYNKGDLVFVRYGDFFSVGGESIYENAIMAEIVSVTASTGTITLSSVIKQSGSNVQVTNVTDVATARCVINCKSAEGTQKAKLFREGGGAYGCTFNVREYKGDSWALCNAFFENTIKSDSVYFDRILYELGVNSSDNKMIYRYAEMMTQGVSGKRVVRTSEQQKRNKLFGDILAMDRYTANDVPFYIESSFNEIYPGEVYAKNAPSTFGQFVSQSFTPTPPKCEGNKFSGKVHAGSGTRYWNYTQDNTSKNTLINSEFYGNVSSNAMTIAGTESVIDTVHMENGRVDVSASSEKERVRKLSCDDTNADFKLRARQSNRYTENVIGLSLNAADRNIWANNITATSTQESDNIYETTYEIGEVSQYDTLIFEIGGEISGTSTTKEIQIVAGGVKVLQVQFTNSEEGDFDVVGKVQFASLTAMVWRFDVNSTSSASGKAQSGGASIPDISQSSLTVQFKGFKGADQDTLRFRIYRQLIDKAGF